MRVAILITQLERGGAERVGSVLASELVECGEDVMIIMFDAAASQYPLHDSVKCENAFAAGPNACVRFVRRLRMFKKRVQAFNPDVMLCFHVHMAIYPLVAFGRRRFAVVASERSNPARRMEPRENPARKWLVRLALPHADGFVFQTQAAAQYYSERIRAKSTVIPNGLFAEDIPAEPTPFFERDPYKLCAVGSLTKAKDYDTMLRAFALFRQTHPRHTLHILGDGGERAHLEARIAELGLGSHVRLMGTVSEPAAFIKDAGMFVMTSVSEGWPNALMEAMACGLPCVCTDCDFGPRDIITDGVNGLLTTVGDPKNVCNAMCRIADDPALAQQMSENALRVRVDYSKARIVGLYRDYLRNMAEKRR